MLIPHTQPFVITDNLYENKAYVRILCVQLEEVILLLLRDVSEFGCRIRPYVESKEPRPSGRGFLEHLYLLRLTLLGFMKPDILLDHVGGYFLAYRACKISIFPKLPTP